MCWQSTKEIRLWRTFWTIVVNVRSLKLNAELHSNGFKCKCNQHRPKWVWDCEFWVGMWTLWRRRGAMPRVWSDLRLLHVFVSSSSLCRLWLVCPCEIWSSDAPSWRLPDAFLCQTCQLGFVKSEYLKVHYFFFRNKSFFVSRVQDLRKKHLVFFLFGYILRANFGPKPYSLGTLWNKDNAS